MLASHSEGYRVPPLVFPVILISIIFASGTLQPAVAQNVRAQWVARVNGLIPQPNDRTSPKAIAGDMNGNVYATGAISVTNSDTEALTINYDPFGKVLWRASLKGPGGFAGGQSITVDAKENVYVLGSLNLKEGQPELFTAKYNSQGVRQWIYFDEKDSFPSAITIDKAGNVYITGYTLNRGVWSTVKYSPNGAQLWAASLTRNTANTPSALVADGQGNVYVAGQDGDNSPFFSEAVAVKYSATGTQLWLQTFRGDPGNNPGSTAGLVGIGLDSAGNVYAGGSSTITPFTGPSTGKALLIKYTPAGSRVWLKEHGPTNTVNGFTVDGTGHGYMTGSNYHSGTNASDYLTLKFDANGNFLWERLYNSIGVGYDVAYAVALDPSGSAYVTGASTDPGHSTSTNITTVKYDTNGNQKWVARYQGPTNGDDTGIGVTYLSLGKLAVTGYGSAGSTNSWFTIGYTQY